MNCLKCKSDAFSESTIFVKSLDIKRRYSGAEDSFKVLICKKCGLAQWYEIITLTNAEEVGRNGNNSVYEVPRLLPFKCLNCKSEASYNKRGDVLSKIESNWQGEVLFRVCHKCALTELHEIVLSRDGRMEGQDSFKKCVKIAEDFKCPVCAYKKVKQTGNMAFKGIFQQPKSVRAHEIFFIFATCERCRYIMVFGD